MNQLRGYIHNIIKGAAAVSSRLIAAVSISTGLVAVVVGVTGAAGVAALMTGATAVLLGSVASRRMLDAPSDAYPEQKNCERVGKALLLTFSCAAGGIIVTSSYDILKSQESTPSAQANATPTAANFNVHSFGEKGCIVQFAEDGSYVVLTEGCEVSSFSPIEPR